MKYIRIFILLTSVCIFTIACGNNGTEIDEEKVEKVEIEENEKSYTYDELQTIFIELDIHKNINDVEEYISKYDLYHTIKEYNTAGKLGKEIVYKIAYTEGASLQKYADSGDYLEIAFDADDKSLKNAFYSNSHASYSGLFYIYGNWYDFSDSNAEDYSGYYINDPFGDDEGIVIKYANGNECKTNYYKYDTADEVIKQIIDNKE